MQPYCPTCQTLIVKHRWRQHQRRWILHTTMWLLRFFGFMDAKLVVMRCSACGATKEIKPDEVPGPGKCLPCHVCLGIMEVAHE